MYWFIGTLFMLVQQQVANQMADKHLPNGGVTTELIVSKTSKKSGKKVKVVIES